MEISPYLWLAGFLTMLMVLIFIAWILAQLVLSKAEPGTDEHKIVKWWAALLSWPVVIIGYVFLPLIGGIFLVLAVSQLIWQPLSWL